jgi:hypothetical protein
MIPKTQIVHKCKECFILKKFSMLGSPITRIERQPSELASLIIFYQIFSLFIFQMWAGEMAQPLKAGLTAKNIFQMLSPFSVPTSKKHSTPSPSPCFYEDVPLPPSIHPTSSPSNSPILGHLSSHHRTKDLSTQ